MGGGPPVILHRIEPGSDAAWRLMPHVLRRVIRFCIEQPTELNPDEMHLLVRHHFFTGSPQLGLWAVEDDAGTVVAHVLAVFDTKQQHVFIYQLQIDREVGALRRDALQAVEDWARAMGATAIQAVTWQPTRLWQRYGFEEHRRVVRRKL